MLYMHIRLAKTLLLREAHPLQLIYHMNLFHIDQICLISKTMQLPCF